MVEGDVGVLVDILLGDQRRDLRLPVQVYVARSPWGITRVEADAGRGEDSFRFCHGFAPI